LHVPFPMMPPGIVYPGTMKVVGRGFVALPPQREKRNTSSMDVGQTRERRAAKKKTERRFLAALNGFEPTLESSKKRPLKEVTTTSRDCTASRIQIDTKASTALWGGEQREYRQSRATSKGKFRSARALRLMLKELDSPNMIQERGYCKHQRPNEIDPDTKIRPQRAWFFTKYIPVADPSS